MKRSRKLHKKVKKHTKRGGTKRFRGGNTMSCNVTKKGNSEFTVDCEDALDKRMRTLKAPNIPLPGSDASKAKLHKAIIPTADQNTKREKPKISKKSKTKSKSAKLKVKLTKEQIEAKKKDGEKTRLKREANDKIRKEESDEEKRQAEVRKPSKKSILTEAEREKLKVGTAESVANKSKKPLLTQKDIDEHSFTGGRRTKRRRRKSKKSRKH